MSSRYLQLLFYNLWIAQRVKSSRAKHEQQVFPIHLIGLLGSSGITLFINFCIMCSQTLDLC